MLLGIVKYLKYGNLFCSAEHINSSDGLEEINCLLLRKKKHSFYVHNTFNTTSINALAEFLAPKQHLFLNINTSNVLSKTLEGVFADEKALQLAFQNLKIQDFYYEVYSAEKTTLVAICRKEVVHTILDSYKAHKLNIVGFSLGNLSVTQLEGLIDYPEVVTSNSKVTFVNEHITYINPITPKDTAYTINGLALKNTSLTQLSGILAYYAGKQKNSTNFYTAKDNTLEKEFALQRFFELTFKGGLALTFVLLLVSFLLFSNYNSKIEALSATLALNKTHKNNLLQLTSEVQKKEKLIQDFSLTTSKSSWYLDQIAQTVPLSISLSEIEWQPLAKNIKEDQIISVEKHIIFIKGNSTNASQFSAWITLLEQLNWVEKITINNYGSGKKSDTSFELIINYKV